ncbi:hypothetical protein BU24DRAFT_101890 [Aaosphaeria arxii CBS 175.79]|uniref:DUF7603 domain-containing protein n=1 Tax=Aaosphaeria arxii CBS 175.79 TaxID=1450172 RepID=A0A6A5XZF2_9PLEO|nr:uncharacterized protein BU24DRAFT_101890 [Aaosphaeria arxii CBS 175.79]KAF2018675.1 hypothetical protein BU24DRAFT_101890 [Aaosphaeria arxii CBS 175.79]
MQAANPPERLRADASSSLQQSLSSSSSSPSPPRSNPPTLATIAISSFAAFRSQTSTNPVPSPVRRKPLPANSPVAGRFVSAEYNKNQVVDRTSLGRTSSSNSNNPVLSPSFAAEDDLFVPRNLDENPHGRTPVSTTAPKGAFISRKSSLSYAKNTSTTSTTSTSNNYNNYTFAVKSPRHGRSVSNSVELKIQVAPSAKGSHIRSPTMPNMPVYNQTSQQPRPPLRLQLDGVTEDYIDEDPYDISPTEVQPPKPKSPAGGTKFGSFFGWNSSKQQTGLESPTTPFSDRSISPAASPRFPNGNMAVKAKPAGLDIPVANSFGQSSYFNVPGTPLLSSSPQMNAHVEELERELREVSSELANSIRRELELEDEVERYKAESGSFTSENRRTSDYYSDSGTSSIRFPITDTEGKLEEVEMLRRKAEQERAQLKVHMAERLQDELRRRRDLEEQVQQLEDRVSTESKSTTAPTGKVRELEIAVDDLKRRLSEERQAKENFEDLLSVLREQLEQHRNEADNLRDEVVPQLKARLEGLESEASQTQSLIYESTRMQQEIQTLRNENQTLQNARRMQQEISQQSTRFQSIAEDPGAPLPSAPKIGLSRSNSLARSSSFNPKRGSLSRSNSVKDRSVPVSPQEQHVAGNPVKELEEQRDALHKALKHLLQRQEMQQKDFQKRIKELEMERDAALNLTPRRTAFHQEVSHLREEVNSLRRRADDALDQKWQCEKGLGGLRMDLDRAQQETASLRGLLQDHDITIPEIRIENEPMSVSLDKALGELQTTHALSIARIRQMDSQDSLDNAGAEAERTLALLKQSISDAETERDMAQKEAEQYRQQARALQRSELQHLGKEQKLSTELLAAATRMDELSERIQEQLLSNSSLRTRLTEAITRGEKEQFTSTEKIIELERRLKSAEDSVLMAQQSSEEAISKHEEEVQALRESHNSLLHRAKNGLLSPRLSPNSPTSPVFSQRSPRLDQTTTGPAMSMAEATRTELLEKRVGELEKALRDADHEMEEVVGRMNMAQIEVADLQFERDEAMRKTRKLQADIVTEREKVKALMEQSPNAINA